ncbi:hypothetical protein HY625_01350 [Candidatus Uhrbacteria bacterium]|nr:hypothetical protein [Candidatus Uhrbacteria bacterium]
MHWENFWIALLLTTISSSVVMVFGTAVWTLIGGLIALVTWKGILPIFERKKALWIAALVPAVPWAIFVFIYYMCAIVMPPETYSYAILDPTTNAVTVVPEMTTLDTWEEKRPFRFYPKSHKEFFENAHATTPEGVCLPILYHASVCYKGQTQPMQKPNAEALQRYFAWQDIHPGEDVVEKAHGILRSTVERMNPFTVDATERDAFVRKHFAEAVAPLLAEAGLSLSSAGVYDKE